MPFFWDSIDIKYFFSEDFCSSLISFHRWPFGRIPIVSNSQSIENWKLKPPKISTLSIVSKFSRIWIFDAYQHCFSYNWNLNSQNWLSLRVFSLFSKIWYWHLKNFTTENTIANFSRWIRSQSTLYPPLCSSTYQNFRSYLTLHRKGEKDLKNWIRLKTEIASEMI